MTNLLWNKEVEKHFFNQSLNTFASPEQLFYMTDDKRYMAYWEKSYKGKKSTIQARNTLIGRFTETWTRNLIEQCLVGTDFYAVQSAVCPEISLPKRSEGDVVIAKRNKTELHAQDIVVIFEVKMSIVSNWEYKHGQLIYLGDYKSHITMPSLQRSDSILKAIGKCINIRIASPLSATIPIVVIGNAPITRTYLSKVDHLKKSGIIQGFWSINPNPLENKSYIIHSPHGGFKQFNSFEMLQHDIKQLILAQLHFFSSMKSTVELGKLIEIANRASSYKQKAEIFLTLLEGEVSE